MRHDSNCVSPAIEVEAGTGPRLPSTRPASPTWPQRPLRLWAPLQCPNHRMARDRNLEIIWQESRVSLLLEFHHHRRRQMEKTPLLMWGGISQNLVHLLDMWPPIRSWTQTIHLRLFPFYNPQWYCHPWVGRHWPRSFDFWQDTILKDPVPSTVPAIHGYEKHF